MTSRELRNALRALEAGRKVEVGVVDAKGRQNIMNIESVTYVEERNKIIIWVK